MEIPMAWASIPLQVSAACLSQRRVLVWLAAPAVPALAGTILLYYQMI